MIGDTSLGPTAHLLCLLRLSKPADMKEWTGIAWRSSWWTNPLRVFWVLASLYLRPRGWQRQQEMLRPLAGPAHVYDWHLSTPCEYFTLFLLNLLPVHCPLAPIMRLESLRPEYNLKQMFAFPETRLTWYEIIHNCLCLKNVIIFIVHTLWIITYRAVGIEILNL